MNDSRQRILAEVAQELTRRSADPNEMPERIVPPRLRGWHCLDVFGNAALQQLGLPTEKVARVACIEAVKAKRAALGHYLVDDVCAAIYATGAHGDAHDVTRAAWVRVAADVLAVVENIDRRRVAVEPARAPLGDEAWMLAMLALEDDLGPFPGASRGAGASMRRARVRCHTALTAILAGCPDGTKRIVYCDDAGMPEAASLYPPGEGGGFVRLDWTDCGALRITAELPFDGNPRMRVWFLSAPTDPAYAGEPVFALDDAIRGAREFLGWRRTSESP